MGRLPKGAHKDVALREQDDFGSGFDFTFVSHAGTGAGAGDGEIQILRAGLRGTEHPAGGQ
jgi:hypothetical protein